MTDGSVDYEANMEEFIRNMFEQNFELLRLESGASIAPDVKEAALQQVLLYWQTMREVAESVTDTEVRLSLPGCETPKGRDFTIEGVVDIVRDDDRTIMYDIKTHDAEYVRANIETYEEQLNVYAHIWQRLRKEALDEAAVIATDFPEGVAAALESGDADQLTYEVGRWNPLIPIAFDPVRVEGTIREFGQIVDRIEDGEFAPRSPDDLAQRFPGSNALFVSRVCINCDARFSCKSYRIYMQRTRGQRRGRSEAHFQKYFQDFADTEQDSWRTANLDAAPLPQDLERDFGEP